MDFLQEQTEVAKGDHEGANFWLLPCFIAFATFC
jgi:hypothetical protein